MARQAEEQAEALGWRDAALRQLNADLAAREEELRAGLREADAARSRMAELQNEAEGLIARAEKEAAAREKKADQLMQKAERQLKSAEVQSAQCLQEAREQADRIIIEANQEADRLRAKAWKASQPSGESVGDALSRNMGKMTGAIRELFGSSERKK